MTTNEGGGGDRRTTDESGKRGQQADKPCKFPWKYSGTGGTLYNGCANPDDDAGGNWCPTALDADNVYQAGKGEWGYCAPNRGEKIDKPCVFPWKHSGTGDTWYTGCANPGNDPGGNWCPTKLGANRVYQSGSGEWGYCNKNSLACNVQGEFIGCYMRCKAEDIIVHMPLSSVCRRVWN